MSGKAKKTRWNSCTVLRMGPEHNQLWQFDSRGHLAKKVETKTSELPANTGRKDWTNLFQPRLNVALLPPEFVFLRVVHLPKADFAETLAMVELQLEKISPMPVAQVVWSMQAVGDAPENQQTLLVTVASRGYVEEFLGNLEASGFLADRLEISSIDQLRAIEAKEDGAWIIPEPGSNRALVSWWYAGVLQNVDFITLPVTNRAAEIREQLMQMAWAGELEGWLTQAPTWHLVGDAESTGVWEGPLREAVDQPIDVVEPLGAADLAASTARRAMAADPKSNLLPADYGTRYQAQFVDRLWMRGVGAVIMAYMAGVAVYMIALQVAQFQAGRIEAEVAANSNSYTNAILLKDRFQVLRDRQELKFAALDGWRIAAGLLPKDVTLDRMNFREGRELTFSGSVPSGSISEVIDFNSAMKKATLNGQPMFEPTKGSELQYRAAQGGNAYTWSFGLELKRGEAQ